MSKFSPVLVADNFVVRDVENGFDYDSADGSEGDFEDGSVDDSVRGSVAAAEH